ncbi:flagellar associated protein [Thecamonas trahens ATCC 50062]|uniref:Cilia- and flagella-associated protein 53 n=1 Tax=Thecamonas trahens ATCC 50062 TaxID=461836 RepID=A0A0L0DRB0_THETB|nr:flagellar associated protein [Thecamonas trahens ATCC 50062]KNC53983.1 flagellar associated protein [Thecamonas trahens ATCC 50062]|eukprot:XP_013754185.1 flagellar associated protein [Thecamonas trahens ATCC 50062]
MAYVPSRLIEQRRRREDAIRAHQEKVNYLNEAQLKAEFEQRTNKRIRTNNVRRTYDSLKEADDEALATRKAKLRQMYAQEEQVLREEIALTYETPEQRIERMRARAQQLREEREDERAKFAQEQMDRRWRAECDEIRHLKSQKMQQMVNAEREQQLEIKARQREARFQEEAEYAAQWEANRQLKIEREVQDRQRAAMLTREMMGTLEDQMAEHAARKAAAEAIKTEEAALLQQQWELDAMAADRRKLLHAQQTADRRAELDYYNQLSLARRQEEARRERENDIKIINDLVEAEKGVEEREAATRLALKAEALEYRSHLLRQMEREAANDAKLDRMRAEQLEVEWAKRQAQWDAEARAREALMAEVFEARRQQIAIKLARKAEERREQVLACERLEREMEMAKVAESQEAANKLAKEREYKRALLIQAEQRATARDRAEERERREYESMREEREAYERRLARELQRDVSLGDHRRTKASVYHG